ncbi:MAG: efflux transporter outer membrane subunit [Deltaproteobacteria bacterium]|nr:efflux transporter outer membrane subunit [Deltaproteobacteria bacterium]
MKNTRSLALLLLLPLASAGCALHKVETAPSPALPLPQAFDSATEGEPAPDRWWKAFGDPTLDALMEETLAGNLQLEQMWARLDQLEAIRRQAGAARFPAVQMDVGVSERRLQIPAFDPTNPTAGITYEARTQEAVSASISAAYELDYLRKNDYRARAGAHDAAAMRDSLEATAMTLTASLAESYFNLVMQRERIALLEAQLETNRTYLELLQLRFDSALASALDLHQQEQQVANTEGQLAAARGQAKVAGQQLAVLLGRVPTGYVPPETGALPEVGELPATGLPSDLLVRRPDVRAAQRGLVAADYRLGASIADRLPSIRLSASASLQTPSASGVPTSLEDFFSAPLFNLLAGLTQPLFQAGRLKAETDRNRAVVDEKAAAFAQTFVQAVFEVESAAVLERAQEEQIGHSEKALQAAQGALEDARVRYEQGLIDTYLPVLTALTGNQLTEQALLASRRQRLSYRIQLYRALGGSWTAALDRPVREEAAAAAKSENVPSHKEG